MKKTKITIETTINAPIEKVWNNWIEPEHIIKWNTASEDWHTPTAQNDFKVGGKSKYRMEAKDGSMGFDFEAVYTQIIYHKKIASTLSDERTVEVNFEPTLTGVKVIQTFEAENQNPVEMQQMGWQAILNNFKKHVES
jgi:uncharacterized protein YndB with AHSA1/START domain